MPANKRGDLLSVLEAAYSGAESPDAWLRNALEAIQPHLDQGGGVFAQAYSHSGSFHQGRTVGCGASRTEIADLDAMVRWQLQALPGSEAIALARRLYPGAPRVAWISDLLGSDFADVFPDYLASLSEAARRRFLARPHGLGVIAGDPSGHGCVFFTRAPRVTPLPRSTAAALVCVAAHLATGYRLARRRAQPDAPDAILDPAGKILHLEFPVTPSQRSSLSDATRAIDRARGQLRRVDPGRALALWKGLVDGRWTLVDHFDHDGRRFVVARRNGLPLRRWSSLTEREAEAVAFRAQGQPLKLVAYQLGVAPSTVSADLTSAMRKLGVSSQLALIEAYRTRGRPGEGP